MTGPVARFGLAVASVVLAAAVAPAGDAVAPPARWEARAAGPLPVRPAVAKLTPVQLRGRADAAEAVGDWEGAFAALCELHHADRAAADVRDRLNAALRRVQQLRRHRDPRYREYVAALPLTDAVALFAEVVAKVPGLHADPARSTPQQLWAGGVEELDRALGRSEFRRAYLDRAAADAVEAFRATLRTYWAGRPVADARDARAELKQLVAAALDALRVATPAALAVEVVCGACGGLDEYTVFLPPAPSAAADAPADLAAYGLHLAAADGGLTVEGVAAGSWAAFQTPLKTGDRLARVNGRPADLATLADALRSPVAGLHELELASRDPEMPRPVVRLPANLPTVYGGRVVNTRDGVGYLRVGGFGPTTPRELTEQVTILRQTYGLRALVLDLRGNHGGSFLAAVEVARRLLPAGLIVTTQGQLGAVAGQAFSSDSGMSAIDLPLVVLIDADTASAAEVVAAALKEHNRAELVGVPTFGKGAVQWPLPVGDGRPATVRLTIARLFGPKGQPLNGVGVVPHLHEADAVRQWGLAVERAAELARPMAERMPPMMPMTDD